LVQIDVLDLPAPSERDDDREFTGFHNGDVVAALAIHLPVKGPEEAPRIRLIHL
jgi:hypothetical protein